MFFTYLRRELRGRMRQAVFISLGLAIGVGLVITVTATSAGVKNAQGTVLHALYGVGTDVTVTKTPKAGSFTPGSFGFGFRTGTNKRPAPGTKINDSTLAASRRCGLPAPGPRSPARQYSAFRNPARRLPPRRGPHRHHLLPRLTHPPRSPRSEFHEGGAYHNEWAGCRLHAHERRTVA
jgi:hypothetical protein